MDCIFFFGPFFGPVFGPLFGDIYKGGGKHTISTQEEVG